MSRRIERGVRVRECVVAVDGGGWWAVAGGAFLVVVVEVYCGRYGVREGYRCGMKGVGVALHWSVCG